MKRITKRIKQFQGFALIFDILYVILGLFAFLYLFSILIEPEVITDIVNENYNILGLV